MSLADVVRQLWLRCSRACVDSAPGSPCGCQCGGRCHAQRYCSCGQLEAPAHLRVGEREDGRPVTRINQTAAQAGGLALVTVTQEDTGADFAIATDDTDPGESRVVVGVWLEPAETVEKTRS